MGRTPAGSTKSPADATPETPANGIPENADLATLQALADQARAALAAVTAKVEAREAAEAAKARREALSGVHTAAERIVAQTGDEGEANLEKLVEDAKAIWTTVQEMAKAAKVRTGGSRNTANIGGAIRAGSDADVANEWLKANPGWHSVREVAEQVETAQGYAHKADGQVRNALTKLVNTGHADHRDTGRAEYRAHVAPETPEVLAGVTTEGTTPPAPEGEQPSTPTE